MAFLFVWNTPIVLAIAFDYFSRTCGHVPTLTVNTECDTDSDTDADSLDTLNLNSRTDPGPVSQNGSV